MEFKMFSQVKNITKVIMLTGVVSFSAVQASAQSTEVNTDWEGHKTNNFCYAVSFPTEDSAPSKYVKNSRYITVTNRPDEKIDSEIAFVSGFQKDMAVEGSVSIDGNLPFQLLYYNGVGFAKSGDSENMLISQMKAGRVLEVKWTDSNGEYFVDKYSLLGFTATENFISDC
jgi:hypothetical protein